MTRREAVPPAAVLEAAARLRAIRDAETGTLSSLMAELYPLMTTTEMEQAIHADNYRCAMAWLELGDLMGRGLDQTGNNRSNQS